MSEPQFDMGDARKKIAHAIHAHRKLYLFAGIALILVGMVAIAFPHVSTLAAAIFIGWLLLIGGVVQGAHAFSLGSIGARLWGSLLALISILAGVWVILNPLLGAVALTIILSAYFFADGITRIIAAFRFRPLNGWIFVALSGVVSAFFGIFLFLIVPEAGDWVIGLMVGVNLVMTGATLLMLSASAKSLAEFVDDRDDQGKGPGAAA